jgi:hypothetical protein
MREWDRTVDFFTYLTGMKRFCLLLSISALLLAACSKTTAVTEKLSTCDSLVIEFYAPNTDSVVKTFQATDKNAIRKLTGFIDRKEAKEYQCGYDGNMIFYKAGQAVLPVVFKYKDANCRHFMFEFNGKTQSTKMNQEGTDFLIDLEKAGVNR